MQSIIGRSLFKWNCTFLFEIQLFMVHSGGYNSLIKFAVIFTQRNVHLNQNS